MSYHGIAVLPTGESINPLRSARGNPLYDDALVAYVMFKTSDARTRPTRVLTSHGPLDNWHIGTEHELYHDQSGAQLGTYRVVGVRHFGSGETAGNVPDNLIKHAVFK